MYFIHFNPYKFKIQVYIYLYGLLNYFVINDTFNLGDICERRL